MVSFTDECSTDMVEQLVKGASMGMSNTVVPNITTHEEVISAAFTFLDRTLRSVRKLQSPEDRFENASLIRKVLDDLKVDHGNVPS